MTGFFMLLLSHGVFILGYFLLLLLFCTFL